MQRLREEERKIIYDKYKTYENEIITGEVSREDKRFTYVDLGDGVEGAMGFRDKMPNEHYHVHDRIQVYVTKVNDDRRGPQIFVSRTAPELLKRLFEREVPEIKDGTVLIENIAREAGDRAKVAVYSNDPNVDPVGTCVGPRGSRVQAIVNELEEKAASETEDSEGEETTEGQTERSCTVVVPDSQLSLAIGKRGQNARLAARLTKYKIDIKSESEMAENDQESEEVADSEENIDNNEE